MKIALAQINPVVGDLQYNTEKIIAYTEKARRQGADLVVFPELSLTGYPPRDLLLSGQFINAAADKLKKIAAVCENTGVLLGAPLRQDDRLYNSAILLAGGCISGIQHKTLLPFYDVFDEKRYFAPAARRQCIDFRGIKLGVTVCEDIWNDKDFWHRQLYDIDPVEELIAEGADIIINLSSSPYSYGKHSLRAEMLSKAAIRHRTGVLYVNQVGGNDHLVFDGSSCAVTDNGALIAQLPSFQEELAVCDTETLKNNPAPPVEINENIGWVYRALTLGTRDYLYKNGFRRALVGLSGGIDSSVTAALAADALGPSNVIGISMPSRYSSSGSKDDARALAENLGIEYRVIPIENIFQAYIRELNPTGKPVIDLAEENVQARIRGNILMFVSNREGPMVLTTGNKSEMAMGYSTLYGDMSGGLSVLADVPKVMVYELAEFINRDGDIIPRSVIDKPPSAELRPDQKDEDSLPPYPVLDQILKAYIEDIKSVDEIAAMGYGKQLVTDIARRVDNAEYKRQQAPPGIRVTSRAFGPGRRIPIAQRWRSH
ncbi:NAD+ synthase (glutamine-hydrolysing) [Desulfotomaculum arcticum]|uniref:Glutamine-dependent NAD(+) synthetase n=2 Tax=Desulfotruncus TaxID=2867377 RepID=A0A1I2U077_9FIRM|nr:NAD+ synthase [Desulfotruncus arcticus]SFG70540.1 NAD+ synthase (glutamine-hydrolysing) [Desulfotomaculum arcticum] [Desulfotruncus arcticus DSM 17038]